MPAPPAAFWPYSLAFVPCLLVAGYYAWAGARVNAARESLLHHVHRWWPFVTKRRLRAAVAAEQVTIRERDRQLSRLGHKVEETKREHAKLLTDLRLVRVQIEYPSPASDRIGFAFQMHGGVFDGFRGDRNFVELLAYMIEDQMHRTPEGRETLAGLYTGRRW